MQISHDPSRKDVQADLDLVVKAAADWQASGLQRQGSNTGVCLRSNFLLMADIVVKQDSHLLLDTEQQLLTDFKVSPTLLDMGHHADPAEHVTVNCSEVLKVVYDFMASLYLYCDYKNWRPTLGLTPTASCKAAHLLNASSSDIAWVPFMLCFEE